jgi:hypothetical protein
MSHGMTFMPNVDLDALVERKHDAVRKTLAIDGAQLSEDIRANIVADGHVVTGNMLNSVEDPMLYEDADTFGAMVQVGAPYTIFPEAGFVHYAKRAKLERGGMSHEDARAGAFIPGTHFVQRAATSARENLMADLPEALRTT